MFSVCSVDDLSIPGEVVCEAETKKQIKMWFSPRSGKMRFVLKRRPKKPQQAVTSKDSKPHDPTSAYDFFPSPPHEKLLTEAKKSQPKCKKKPRKKTLTDINQQWGLVMGSQKNTTCGHEKESSGQTKEKLVSFCSQPLVIPSPNPESTSRDKSVMKMKLAWNESELDMGVIVCGKPTEKNSNDNLPYTCDISEENPTSEECLLSGGEMSLLKRGRQQTGSPTSLSKRSRRKEQSPSGDSFHSDILPKQASEESRNKTSPTTDCISSSPSTLIASALLTQRNPEDFQSARSPILPETPPISSNPARKEAQQVVPFSNKSPHNLSAKRNRKGETLLHVASIEGNLPAVEHLLKSGADPNVKDYAGWTPLHEACHHGHKEAVELLLQHGALLNATGYQNDVPLHDAVKNGHTRIVELLLLRGASRDAVNIFGQRPMDYAETEEMKSLLMLPVKNESSSITQCAEQINLNNPRDGPIVLLGSGLDPIQQQLLSKLAAVLKAKICTTFNSAVTHVVIPEYPVRSTMKCMLAVLTGCWILTLKWVEACLQTGAREQEEKYEIDGGPQRGRLNKEQLLPKLFDGCYFYFLGTFKEHNKDGLKELVKTGGGQILARKPKSDNDVTQTINTIAYHAEINSDQSFCTQYIIYDGSSSYNPEKIRQGKVWEVPAKWLIDCVVSFQLLPVKK
ncbi:BRCA1-associated RING domain protein 1 isoform X2 [Hemicordylus capensis]|uniref:BRCA1-associated RING domain protein 1 isoform X2 n=1 Tax=Hemicordylus capensis TaxID=884348 RepID=UPI0023040C1D|nr:BRCA1-associated RING domain protein 1 isoform X2 [Hemicordylus capensis]XP_053143397.1 BRCA1-associated RING domain protein 1 isoform X2 [Hemicordylus capensis]